MSNQISQEVHTSLNWMDRSAIVSILEGISIQCYDHESDQVLREAVIQNIEDGTLEESEVIAACENVLEGRRSSARMR